MNYELAKKLKDAGFPQIEHYDETDDLLQFHINNEFISIPTLSELIDACGDGFRFLIHEKDPRSLKEWRCNNDKSEWKEDGFWGKTPEEAVANLWLALNKHLNKL